MAARVAMPAIDGPTSTVPAVVEWQLKHAGGERRKTASPNATGSPDAAAVALAAVASGSAALTTIGRGGQPWLSMFETHARKAMTSVICSSESFMLGITRP